MKFELKKAVQYGTVIAAFVTIGALATSCQKDTGDDDGKGKGKDTTQVDTTGKDTTILPPLPSVEISLNYEEINESFWYFALNDPSLENGRVIKFVGAENVRELSTVDILEIMEIMIRKQLTAELGTKIYTDAGCLRGLNAIQIKKLSELNIRMGDMDTRALVPVLDTPISKAKQEKFQTNQKNANQLAKFVTYKRNGKNVKGGIGNKGRERGGFCKV